MNIKALPIGATPINDLSELIPEHITTFQDLSNAEFKNIAEATAYYLTARRQFTFSLTLTYQVHRKMFCYVWRWAGKKRNINLNIGVDKTQIDIELKKLFDDLKFWESHYGEACIATWLHHRLVKIHPFVNGNGRWARLIVNLYLKQKKHKLLVWPELEISKSENFRNNYIKALRAADTGDYTELLKIHENLMKD